MGAMDPEPTGTPMDEETLVSTMSRLRKAGFTADFNANDDGELVCSECGMTIAPEDAIVSESYRFEGASNPDDEAILVAISCECSCKGLFTSGYGTSAPTRNARALRALAARGI